MSDWKDKLGELHKGGVGVKKKCADCGKEFFPKEAHHKTCFECAKKKKDGGFPPLKLPANYLNNSYFDDKEHLREGIFKEEAKEVANILASEGLSPTALRVFYNKLKAIESRYKSSKNDFELIKPNLYAFERDVAYQASRGVVREEFRKFITINAALAAKGPKEFKGFIEHFLSVLAYFKDVGK